MDGLRRRHRVRLYPASEKPVQEALPQARGALRNRDAVAAVHALGRGHRGVVGFGRGDPLRLGFGQAFYGAGASFLKFGELLG